MAGPGGIFANHATITGSNILENSTSGGTVVGVSDSFGGGVAVLFDAVFNRSVIADNFTSGELAAGGGAFVHSAKFMNTTINGNHTTGKTAQGGGIRADGKLEFDQLSVATGRKALTLMAVGSQRTATSMCCAALLHLTPQIIRHLLEAGLSQMT